MVLVKEMKKIAVLLSSYNGEKYIKTQIDSILNQKCSVELTLIIRDDGSTDNTLNILDEYRKDNRVIVIKGKNVGPARGFLELIKNNIGYDYYALSDQDDFWYENKLQRGIDKIKDIDEPILYCSNSELVDDSLNNIGRNTHRAKPTYTLESVLCLASCAQGCTSIFNNELANIIQENDLPNSIVMHDSLLSCLCLAVNGEIIYDHIPTMKYRMTGNNILGLSTKKQFGLCKMIIKRCKEITSKRQVSASDQAKTIISSYGKYINNSSMNVCKVVASSKNSMISRIKLILNKRLKADTLNMTIAKKITILLGNN